MPLPERYQQCPSWEGTSDRSSMYSNLEYGNECKKSRKTKSWRPSRNPTRELDKGGAVALNTVWRRHIDHLKEITVAASITKEQCTPQLDPAVLVEIQHGPNCVRSEESQPPFVSGVEETSTINRDDNSFSNSPLSSPNEIMISSSATPPPSRYPLRLRKPLKKLNL